MAAGELRKIAAGALLLLTSLFFPGDGMALEVSSRYRSPRNPERKIRQSTELIVLHTTEAPARSSLCKVSERGECHYCVTEEGSVYRIVDRDREAFHAGRSMWNGREDVDKYSVGIECVGYHNKPMSKVQLYSIRDLVRELKATYHIPDERVVCHSHVAYGAPNRWHRQRHRGRKRCGMLFAMPSVRRILGLSHRPAFDADTRARRLVVGDDYLNRVLYGSVDTMVCAYGRETALTVPKYATAASAMTKTTVSTRLAVTNPTQKRPELVLPRTIPKSIAQLKSGGFVKLGVVTKVRPAIKIAGSKWNAADTYYEIRGKVIPGSAINPAHIEKGMSVWRKK